VQLLREMVRAHEPLNARCWSLGSSLEARLSRSMHRNEVLERRLNRATSRMALLEEQVAALGGLNVPPVCEPNVKPGDAVFSGEFPPLYELTYEQVHQQALDEHRRIGYGKPDDEEVEQGNPDWVYGPAGSLPQHRQGPLVPWAPIGYTRPSQAWDARRQRLDARQAEMAARSEEYPYLEPPLAWEVDRDPVREAGEPYEQYRNRIADLRDLRNVTLIGGGSPLIVSGGVFED